MLSLLLNDLTKPMKELTDHGHNLKKGEDKTNCINIDYELYLN